MTPRKNEALLKHIRDRHRYLSDCWREAREERATDMRFIDGDPWDEKDRQAREDAGRPCISHDELGQYVIAAVNSVRQNPRGIKIEPRGNGSNDKSAETRQRLVRTIEYRSHGASIYSTAFQAMVEGSYGFFRVSRRYVADDSFDQQICIGPIANADSVLFDWDCKEPDWSDAKDCFVLDPISREEFKQRWPGAEIQDFTAEDMRVASQWIDEKNVLVAEYWRIETTPATLYELEDGSTVNELPEGVEAKRSRKVPKKSLVQYITNGVEILERNPQPGTILPIIPMIGLQRYLGKAGQSKRKIYSLIRLARDPQMSLAYLCSQEAEEAGLTPKSPYVGYVGQFETDREAWETANKKPHSFLQADAIIDSVTGQVVPLPRRESFTPNFAQYEVAKESDRRAIQAAVGISPLPTAAQRDNAKSGVALEHIQQQMDTGSFHFVDSYERALELAGRVVDSWIPATYDTEREEALRKPDDSQQVVKLNTEAPYQNAQGAEEHFPVGEGDHDVTVSTAPSMQSQREAASDFLDLLVAKLGALPVPPQSQAKLLGMAIRMKNLGPKGDEMADIISPPENGAIPPQAQAQLQQAHLMIQQLTGALNKLTQKLEAKLPELENKRWIELVKAKAGIIEAALKDSSSAALATFQADIEHIDRMLSLMPDPLQPEQAQQPQPAQPQPIAA